MYKVLLVDDEPGILDAERRAIEKRTEGFTVEAQAYTVTRAIEIIEACRPEVILTDICMPGRSGIVLIQYISGLENYMPACIAVSGYADFNYVHDAFMHGAYDYLLKPVEPDKIAELFGRISCLLASTREPGDKKLPPAKVSGQELVSSIEKHVRNHLSEDNSIIRMCSRFMISQPYLSKIFKKYKGCTYNEFVMNVRMEEARRLLENGDYLIGEVAQALGYADQFYFSKVFKTMTGCTPREYRARFLKV